MNWNIKLAYIMTVTSAVGFGIIQTAFSVYIYTLSISMGIVHPNVVLGSLFTVSGLASTLFVFPSGYIADRYRRDVLIRISVFFGLISQLLLVISTIHIGMESLALLFISQLSGGLAWGISGPAAQALIADSIELGRRSRVFANMHFANLISAAIGPFLAAALTIVLGDTWQLDVLRVIIFIGTIATSTSYLSMAFVSDDRSLVTSVDRKKERELVTHSTEYESEHEILNLKVVKLSKPMYDWVVPTMIVVSGLLIGFGAGATVAFFPVLFASKEIGYGLMPMLTYTIVGVTNIITGFFGLGAQRLIKYTGRIYSMFLTQGSAILCLIGLIVNLFLFQNRIISYDVSVILLIIFYIFRASLMNASGPISRSIVMDIVPPSSRAKWNSLESLAWGMMWSLSASLGGAIVDTFGFMYVFLFTATLYTIATLLLLVIRDRVPKESLLTRSYRSDKLKARNRIVLPSKAFTKITEIRSEYITGYIPKDEAEFYVDAAKGGAAIIFFEPAFIHQSGRSSLGQIGIHDDYVLQDLKNVVKSVHSNKALVGIRIKHAGVVSSRLFHEGIDLESEGLSQIYLEYLDAAKRAVKADFDVIELAVISNPPEKSTLLGQIVSLSSSRKTDNYKGSHDRRIKYILDVVKGIRSVIPPYKMLSFHISLPIEGLSSDDVFQFVAELCKTECLDILSLGQNTDEVDTLTDSFVNKIKELCCDLPIILHGNFDISNAEDILRKGKVDLIGFEQLFDVDSSFPRSLR